MGTVVIAAIRLSRSLNDPLIARSLRSTRNLAVRHSVLRRCRSRRISHRRVPPHR
jgi:hypothetical protein